MFESHQWWMVVSWKQIWMTGLDKWMVAMTIWTENSDLFISWWCGRTVLIHSSKGPGTTFSFQLHHGTYCATQQSAERWHNHCSSCHHWIFHWRGHASEILWARCIRTETSCLRSTTDRLVLRLTKMKTLRINVGISTAWGHARDDHN